MRTEKQKYLSPEIEVISMENEGVIAGSGNISDLINQDWGRKSSSSYRSGHGYNSASTSDLEDLINDILTVGD